MKKRKQRKWSSFLAVCLVMVLSMPMTLWAASYEDEMLKNCGAGLNTYNVTMYPGEQFQLIPSVVATSWSSSSTAVATVDNSGMVRALKAGTATITAQTATESLKCRVTVEADQKNYSKTISSRTYKVYTTTKTFHASRYDLIVDPGVYIPSDVVKHIDRILNLNEKVTGLSYTPAKTPEGVEVPTDGFTIRVMNTFKHAECYVMGEKTLYASPDCIAFGSSSSESILIHELLHVLQSRNSSWITQALSEGFAEAYEQEVMNRLSYDYDYDSFRLRLANIKRMLPELWQSGDLANYIVETEDDALSHETSAMMVFFLREKYGDETVRKILVDVTELSTMQDLKNPTYACDQLKAVYEVVKKNTSANLDEELNAWFKEKCRTTDLQISDYTNGGTITASADNYNGSFNVSLGNTSYKIKKETTFDFVPAVSYCQQVLGAKYMGLLMNVVHTSGKPVKAAFYDGSGKSLGFTTFNQTTSLCVPGAASVVFSADQPTMLTISVASTRLFKTNSLAATKLTPELKVPVMTGLTKSGKVLQVKWKKVSGISGYQIEYATDKNFADSKIVNVNKAKVSTKISNLKSKKSYYVRIRTMKKSGNTTTYSRWSAAKKMKM